MTHGGTLCVESLFRTTFSCSFLVPFFYIPFVVLETFIDELLIGDFNFACKGK